MGKSRILILHSFKNPSYEERLRQIANNPRLDSIVFQHFCIIDRGRSSTLNRRIIDMLSGGAVYTSRIPEFSGSPDTLTSYQWNEEYGNSLKRLLEADVGPLLDQLITDFKPEVIIIHGGTIFEAVPEACITMVMELMEKYPNLPFALQGKQEWLDRQFRRFNKTFHPSDIRRTIEQPWDINQMRWVRDNFIDHAEVQTSEQRGAINQMRWVRDSFIDDAEVQRVIDDIF